MLSLDIPFQIFNFVLFGFVSDAVLNAGYETSILTRLFCGITCGMVSAFVTCPIDVCKTRIVSRDRDQAVEESDVVIVTGIQIYIYIYIYIYIFVYEDMFIDIFIYACRWFRV
jgi:hypothetical protein